MEGPFSSLDWPNCPEAQGLLKLENSPHALPRGTQEGGFLKPRSSGLQPEPEEMSRDRKPHLSPISLRRLIGLHSPRIQQQPPQKENAEIP